MAPHRSQDTLADLPLQEKLVRLRAEAFVGDLGYADLPWLSAAEVDTLLGAAARIDTLRAALQALLDNPWGCRFCTSGRLYVLRSVPEVQHDADCPFARGRAVLQQIAGSR